MPLLAADGPGSGRGCPSPCRRRRAPSPAAREPETGSVLTAFPSFRMISNTQEKTSLAAAGGRGFALPENGETAQERSKSQTPGFALPAAQEGPHDEQVGFWWAGWLVLDGGCPVLPEHDIAQVDAVDCRGHISRSGFLPRHLAGAGMEPEPQRKPTPCKRQICLLLCRMADSMAQHFPLSRMAVFRARGGGG